MSPKNNLPNSPKNQDRKISAKMKNQKNLKVCKKI